METTVRYVHRPGADEALVYIVWGRKMSAALKQLRLAIDKGSGRDKVGLVLGQGQRPRGRSVCSFGLVVGNSPESSCISKAPGGWLF